MIRAQELVQKLDLAVSDQQDVLDHDKAERKRATVERKEVEVQINEAEAEVNYTSADQVSHVSAADGSGSVI